MQRSTLLNAVLAHLTTATSTVSGFVSQYVDFTSPYLTNISSHLPDAVGNHTDEKRISASQARSTPPKRKPVSPHRIVHFGESSYHERLNSVIFQALVSLNVTKAHPLRLPLVLSRMMETSRTFRTQQTWV